MRRTALFWFLVGGTILGLLIVTYSLAIQAEVIPDPVSTTTTSTP